MVRVTYFLFLLSLAFAGPVDFDCEQIRTETNEPSLLKRIKAGVNKEMRFDKSCLVYACDNHFFNIGEYLIEEFYGKHGIDVIDVIENAQVNIQKN